mgnify:CR=1 FL=1
MARAETDYRSTDHRTDIHAARDSWEAEVRDRLGSLWGASEAPARDQARAFAADAETIGAWWHARALSCEVWTSEASHLEGIKRVEVLLTCGGPTVWVEYDGRYGEHGHAHFNHSWGADYRGLPPAYATTERREDCPACVKVETDPELVARLLTVVGVLA